MNTSGFARMFADTSEQRQSEINRRTELENELVEVRNRIAHLDEILAHLAPLADISVSEDSISGLGLTDAVRKILRTSDKRLSPQDIRKQLLEKDYDFSTLTAPMASIYKILARLSEGDSPEVEREKEGLHVFYTWKTPPIPDDEDSEEEEEIEF
jgi:hypothetical protein